MWRLKITILFGGKAHTFDQLSEGESKNEFRARAKCAVNMPEGAEYLYFEQEGHTYPGPVAAVCPGWRRIHHVYAQDDMLPGFTTYGDACSKVA